MDESIQSYFGVVQRYWKVLLAVTLIPTLTMVIVLLFFISPVYEGSTSVIFPLGRSSSFMRRTLAEMDIPVSGMAGLLDSSPTLYNHIAIIESRTLALRVNDFLQENEGIDLFQTFPKLVRDDELDTVEDQRRALAKRMMRNVVVDDLDRGMAVVKFAHTDPEIAALVANTYVTETLAFLNEINQITQSDLVSFLQLRQAEVDNTLQEVEQEIMVVKETTGILSVEEQARQIITSYADIEALVAQAEIDYQGSMSMARGLAVAGMDMEEYYTWLQAGEGTESDIPPVPALDALADQTIGRLRSELNNLELMRQQAMLYSTPENPEMVLIEAEINATRRELYRELAGFYDATVANLMVETSAYQAQLDVAEEILSELDLRLEEFPPEERHLIELERDRDVQESIYLVITQELEQARIQQMREETPFTVLDEALVPTKPVRPRKFVLTGGTLGISLFLSLIIIFGIDSTRRRRLAGG